jgi:general secretion pathway protein D
VLRDAASTDKLSLDRYDLIRAQQKDSQPSRSLVLPINESPVLPPMRDGMPIQTLPVTPIRGLLPPEPAASGVPPAAPAATTPPTSPPDAPATN